AIDHDGVFAECRIIDRRAQRPADEAGDLVSPTLDLALDRFARHPFMRGLRQHRVFGGDPAEPRAFTPTRHAQFDAGGTQYARLAEFDQARTGGVIEPVTSQRYGT